MTIVLSAQTVLIKAVFDCGQGRGDKNKLAINPIFLIVPVAGI